MRCAAGGGIVNLRQLFSEIRDITSSLRFVKEERDAMARDRPPPAEAADRPQTPPPPPPDDGALADPVADNGAPSEGHAPPPPPPCPIDAFLSTAEPRVERLAAKVDDANNKLVTPCTLDGFSTHAAQRALSKYLGEAPDVVRSHEDSVFAALSKFSADLKRAGTSLRFGG
jgi:hypothetical protein